MARGKKAVKPSGWSALEDDLLGGSRAVVQNFTSIVEDRAHELAPVRKLFVGGRPRVRMMSAREENTFAEFTGRHPGQLGFFGDRSTEPIKVVTRRGRGAGVNSYARTKAYREAEVVQVQVANNTKLVTSRRVRNASPFEAVLNEKGTDFVRNPELNPIRGSSVTTFRQLRLKSQVGMQFLSARGRYEVKSGRALHAKGYGERSAGLFNTTAEGEVGGRLRESINSWFVDEDGRYFGHVGTDVPYAKYQEFGSRHNAAQPFLRPALWGQEKRFASALRRMIKTGGSNR